MPQFITSQPVSISVKETYVATFSVAVNLPEDVGPVPLISPIALDARITYDWQWRVPGVPGWWSANRTITKNTAIPSTWGGLTKDSVYTDSLNLKANQGRSGKYYKCIITYRVRAAGAVNNLSTTILTSTNATLTLSARPHLFNLSTFSIIPDTDIIYRNALVGAANRWNKLVKLPEYFFSKYPNHSGMTLSLYSAVYNTGNWIAQCGPLSGIFANPSPTSSVVPPQFMTHFRLGLNTKYFINSTAEIRRPSSGDWINIMTHELGHALGIGGQTEPYVLVKDLRLSVYVPGPVELPPVLPRLHTLDFPNTVAGYNRIADHRPLRISSVVPVENVGPSGSSGVHWQNNYTPPASRTVVISADPPAVVNFTRPSFNGIVNELMVKNYNPINFITDLSIGQLKDFGYEEVSPGARESGVIIVDSGNIIQAQSMSIYDNFCKNCENIE